MEWSMEELKSKGNRHVYQQPQEIGRFSIDNQRRFHHDRHQMACFSPPEAGKLGSEECPNFDLSDGYKDRFIEKDPEIKENLAPLLHWMLANKHRFDPSNTRNSLKPPQLITWRGNLTKLMCTPKERYDDWMFVAQKFKGIVYLNGIDTQSRIMKRRQETEKQKQMCYWGHKFEKYMVKPFSRRSMTYREMQMETVDTHEAYCSVVKSKVGDRLSLFIGAEVDCCKPVQVLNPPKCYVELKTSRCFYSRKNQDNFLRYKAMKWWAQSYLAGIPQITCGFRDDYGYIDHLQDFSTAELPSMARRVNNSWDGNECLNFLGNILSKIVEVMHSTSEDTVCVLTWDFSDTVSVKMEKSSDRGFLPPWYLEAM